MKRVTLKDGSTVGLRPIRPEDESELTALYDRLSPETAYQRFFVAMARLPPDWARILANVDYAKRMAIVAVGPDDKLVGVARYDVDDTTEHEAELAIVVQDQWQGRGLGTLLMTELLHYAETKGLRRFRAYVLSENRRMLDMFDRLTQIVDRQSERGVTFLRLVPRPAAHPAPR